MTLKSEASPKKTLVILIWNLGIGGVQKRVKDLVMDISAHYPEWKIVLLVKNKKPHCFNHLLTNLPRVTIKYFSLVTSEEHDRIIKKSPVPWIVSEYLHLKPDVCLTFLNHFSVLLVLLKIMIFWRPTKTILNEVAYTSKYLKFHAKRPWLEELLIRLSYRFADTIICPTQAGAKELTSNYWVPQKKIVVVPNWTLYKPQAPLNPKWDLIYVGRFEKEKNLISLLNIVKKLKIELPHIKLLLLGEGSQEFELITHIKNLKINRNVDIIHTTNNVAEYLKKSKIFVILSLNEGFPNVVLEAAMCQIPTVSNNFEGASEVILHGKTGFIAPTIDSATSFLLKLLRNNKLRHNVGTTSQAHIMKHYSLDNQRKFINILLLHPPKDHID